MICLRAKTRLWLERPTKPRLVLNYVVKGLSFITITSIMIYIVTEKGRPAMIRASILAR